MKLFISNQNNQIFKNLHLMILVIILLSNSIKSDSVCSLKTLKTELLEDIADNGMLDCLRTIEKPHFKEETEKEKNLRIKAQWDSSCSFESNNSWIIPLKEQLGVNDLVDVYGNVVKEDFEDQADMCEIVRAAYAKNLFDINNVDIRNIDSLIVDKIDCAGAVGDKEGPRICAASSGSYYNKHSWAIFLTPTFIKFAGKPDFTKKAEEDNRDKTETEALMESPAVVKELLQYNPEQIRNKGGILAKLINKSKSLSSSVEEVIVKPNRPLIPHKTSGGLAVLSSGDTFKPIGIRGITLTPTSRTAIFSFSMISYKLFPNQILKFRFLYNGQEIPETRQHAGAVMTNSLSSAFVRIADADGFNHGVTLEYKSNNDANIDSNGIYSNFSFVSLMLPYGNFFNVINKEEFELEKQTKRFTPVPDLKLVIRHDKPYDADYLIFYNISVRAYDSLNGELLGTVLKRTELDPNNEIFETTQVKGREHYLSNHSAAIVRVLRDTQAHFELAYIYSGASNISVRNDKEHNTSASISALELPKNSKVHYFKLQRNVVLESSTWKNFDFDARLTFDKKTKVLILFNYNLKISKADFTMRLVVNGKHAVRSVMATHQLENASGQGYVVETLDEGSYLFDIEFSSTAKGTILANSNSVSMKVSRQFVTMTIVELEY